MNELCLDITRLENVKQQADGSTRAACPACRASGSDKSGDHLRIEQSGKFGCAANPSNGDHRKQIFKLAGTKPSPETKPRIVASYDYHDPTGNLIYQVCRFDPKTFRQRRPDGDGGWVWNMDGVTRFLFRLPQIMKAVFRGTPIFICEGEKDALAMVQRGFDATTNPGGAGKWLDSYNETLRGADVCIIADKDPAGRAHAQLVAFKLDGIAKSVRVIELPDTNGRTVKDAADFFEAGGNVATISDLYDAAPECEPMNTESANEPEPKTRILTLRSPDELLAMTFDDSDVILGDRLLAKGQPLVIAAQGGTGKSRLALQIVAAIVTGRECLLFDTGCHQMRWLILQTENSNRRLQQDLARMKTWLGDDWQRFAEQVVFHTVENDDDGFVSLDSPDNQLAIQHAIESAKPDGIVIDPLNDFAAGDLNKDADMKNTLQTLSRLCRRGNPQRAIVVLHHSLTGKAGAARVTGYDRASFARNSKTLHAWTRGQINLAPVDADNNDRLIVGCGKCSNGREFSTFAIRLNPEMIYECDPSVDLSAWESAITGKSEGPDLSPEMVAGIVAELGKTSGAPKKPQLVKALRDETGCATGSAYRAIERAEKIKKIHLNKVLKTYAPQKA